MKKGELKISSFVSVLSVVIALLSCQPGDVQKYSRVPEQDPDVLSFIFPLGQRGSTELFTGEAFHFGFSLDSIYNTVSGNVYFKAGARTNWHTHPGGQILIITDGVGYHQIEGEPKQRIKKGDVVQCPPNVLHWHGANADAGLQQIYIVPNIDRGIVDWQAAVTDQEYEN